MIFDALKTTNEIIEFIREYFKDNNLKGVVIGISGGKDSAVVSGLFSKALGSANVIGVWMPCHSKEDDKLDAKLISEYYGFKLVDFDLTNIFNGFKEEIKKVNINNEALINSDINLKPRLRMATLYYLAAMYSAIYKKTYLVAGTSNKSEIFVGYFTKGGDNVCDIAPIADLTKEEVIEIGKCLKVPNKVLYKVPSDGLSGLSDEERLGVTYQDIAKYMIDENNVEKEAKEKIKKLHLTNQHKFNVPTYRK